MNRALPTERATAAEPVVSALRDGIANADLAARIRSGRVKALSIKQPYPHCIFHDGKDAENRDWPTKVRGWFIIHAGVSASELDREDPEEMAMPRGGIVGMARIVDCVTAMDSHWFFGRYGFVLRDAFPVDLIPCKGQLGFFNPPSEALESLAQAIEARMAETQSGSVHESAVHAPKTPQGPDK